MDTHSQESCYVRESDIEYDMSYQGNCFKLQAMVLFDLSSKLMDPTKKPLIEINK